MKISITIKKTVLLVLCSIGLAQTLTAHAEPIPLDEVVAIAERDAIMRSDLDDRIAQTRLQINSRGAPMPPDDVLTQQILDTLILESLQLQLAERAGIRVDDDALNEQMFKIAEQNNMSLTQFSQELTKSGTTYPAVREQVRREMTIAQLRQRQIGQRIRISDQEISRALTSKNKPESAEYHLAAILIKPSSNTPEAIKKAEQTATDVYNEAKSGRNFAQLAAAHSNAYNAKSGGDLGWNKTSQLSTAVAQAIAGLDAGDVSTPFQDAQGFSIIKVLGKRGATENATATPVLEIHARHILISPSKIRSDEQTKELITDIKKQLDQGTDFAALAKKYSDDPTSASAGGDLGWSAPNKFVPEFAHEIETLPLNKISSPFKTKFGWHIVEVLERKNKDNAADQEKENARMTIRKQKYDDELKMWLRQIRQEAFVDIKIK